MEKAEIVIYKNFDNTDFQIEVRVEDETVWLTQAQMVNLFDATKQNISLHINNIFKEGELQRNSVVKEYLTTAADGKKYKTKYYNLKDKKIHFLDEWNTHFQNIHKSNLLYVGFL